MGDVKLTVTGHRFTDREEMVCFTAEVDAPRADESLRIRPKRIELLYVADRYVARYAEGERWFTEWRVLSHASMTFDAIHEVVEPAILAWLAGPEYWPSRQHEIADFIARQALKGDTTAKDLLERFWHEITPADRKRLVQGIVALEKGKRLLSREEEPS